MTNNRIGLLVLAPKKTGATEYLTIIDHTKDLINLITYYKGSGTLELIDGCFPTTLGANNYIMNYFKSVGIPIINLSSSIYDTDKATEDFVRGAYKDSYCLCLWDGVDELVKSQIISANKFGLDPKIKIIKRWMTGQKTFV